MSNNHLHVQAKTSAFYFFDKNSRLETTWNDFASQGWLISPLLLKPCKNIIFHLALESRQVTRWDVHKLTRSAYDLGVRYIGGCCGFKAYHVRAISEEVNIII